MSDYNHNPIDDKFQAELNLVVYSAIMDIVEKYGNYIQNDEALLNSVNTAVDYWAVHYFNGEEWES